MGSLLSIPSPESRKGTQMCEPDEQVRNEQNRLAVQAIIAEANAKKGLITVLTRRLEQSDDLVAKIAAAELRNDPNWRWFTRGSRYDRRRRKIARKRRRQPESIEEFHITDRSTCIKSWGRILYPMLRMSWKDWRFVTIS